MGSILPKLIRSARHYSGLSTVDLRSAAMATVAGSSYGLIHLINVRVGTRGRWRILPSSGLMRRCFGGDAPRAGRLCSTETTRSGSVKASVSSVVLQMDSRCGEEAPSASNRTGSAWFAGVARNRGGRRRVSSALGENGEERVGEWDWCGARGQ